MKPMPHLPLKKTSSRLVRQLMASLCAASLLAACGQKDPADLITQAKDHLAQGNSSTAVIELKNVLQNDPNQAEARYLLGKLLLEQGDARAAEIELRKAYSLKFNSDKTIPELARTMLALNQINELLLEFEGQKLQGLVAQADITTSLGNAYLLTNRIEKAKNAFLEAQQIQPDFIEAILGEARALAIYKDFAGAEARVNAALEKNPKSISALLLMGDLQRAQNKLDQAVQQYQAALAIEPKNFAANFVLANTYLAQNKPDGLRSQVQILKKISANNPAVSYLEAMSALYEKNLKAARDAIQIALAGSPENPQVLVLAGIIEQQVNEPAQSETHLKQAMARLNNDILARKQLVMLYIKQRDFDKAGGLLRPALLANPNDTELINLAGDIAIAKGDFNEAARYYGRSAELNPNNASTLTQSAIAQLASGNSVLGVARLEEASQMDQTNARADVALVLVALNKKDYDQALKAWQTLEKKQPDKPLTYNLRAAILIGKNDIAGARKALDQALQLDASYFPAASNLANLDLRENKPDAAKQRYVTLLDHDKNNLAALVNLAQLERSTGASKAKVLSLLTQAKQGNPDAAEGALALASYQMEMGEPIQALLTANEGLAKHPQDVQLLDLAGMAQMQTGDQGRAIETYTQLAKLQPKEARWLVRLGETQLAAGKVEAATESMTQALAVAPDAEPIQAATVAAFLRTGKVEDAARMLTQIQKRSPKSAALPNLNASIQLARADYPAAIASYRKMFETAPGFNNLVKLHQALSLSGDTVQATSLLDNWLKAHPDDNAATLYAADQALAANDYARASTAYRAVLARQANNVLVLNNLAWASYQLKDGKALEYAEKAYGLAPENPAVLDTYGWILTEQGQAKRGQELLEKAVAKAPNQVDLKLHLAKALLKQGQKDAARTHLQAIVKSAANSTAGKESAQLLTTL